MKMSSQVEKRTKRLDREWARRQRQVCRCLGLELGVRIDFENPKGEPGKGLMNYNF